MGDGIEGSSERDFEFSGGLLRVRLIGRERVVFERWDGDMLAWESTLETRAEYNIDYKLDSIRPDEAAFSFRGDETKGRGFTGGRVTVRLSDGEIGRG